MTEDLESAARGGDSDAAVRLALSYVDSGEADQAQRWCRIAAEAGHRAASYLLGGLLSLGKTRTAVGWWQRATTELGPDEGRKLGELLGWDPDVVAAEYRLRVASEAGDRRAAYELGRLLAQRADTEQAISAFVRARRLAVEAHDKRLLAYTAVRLEAHYRSKGIVGLGSGVPPEDDAVLRAAAQKGDLEARLLLGAQNHRTDSSEAERHYNAAADAELVDAVAAMGQLRLDSHDRDGALLWWRRAAEAGHPAAAAELARHHYLARLDPDEGLDWARRAARAGHPAALGYVCGLERRRRTPAGGSLPRTGTPSRRQSAGMSTASVSTRLRTGAQVDSALPGELAGLDAAVAELLAGWDQLGALSPDPGRTVDHLAQQTQLPRRSVEQARQARNRCAHPAERGWPSRYDLEIAVVTIRELRRRLGLSSDR